MRLNTKGTTLAPPPYLTVPREVGGEGVVVVAVVGSADESGSLCDAFAS